MIKKLIAIIGPKESAKILLDPLERHLKGKLSLNDPFFNYLPEIFRIDTEDYKNNVPFKKPILLEGHHITHFLAKINAGVHSTSKYAGKLLNTPDEVTNYFEHKVLSKILGSHWLTSFLVDEFNSKQVEGVYLLNDQDDELNKSLKFVLTTDFVRIQALGDDEVALKGVFGISIRNKAKAKRELTDLINKLTEKKRK